MRFERHDYHYRKRGDALGTYGQRCLAANDELAEMFSDAIRRGVSDGTIETRHEPHLFNLMIWSAMAGVMQIGVWRREILPAVYGVSLEELFESVLQLLLPRANN